MAQRPHEPPAEKKWTPDTIQGAVRKLRRRLTDVEAFDPQKVHDRFDPAITSLEISIREMLTDVFGPNSRSYRNYSSAATLDTAGQSLGVIATPRMREGLEQGKERSITLLKGAIRNFEEKMQDDFPGERFDEESLNA
jgi:hypothetical protein